MLRAEVGAAIRVVGAYRETEAGPDRPITALLAELAEQDLVEHLTVAPLAEVEALALLDGLLGPMDDEEVKGRIVRRAGGVPFFLVSCAHGLAAGEGAEAVPWTVAQSIRGRVAALPPAAQEALRGAAVVGRKVERAVLLRALGSRTEVLVGLDTACRAQLLVSDGRSAYQFAHDVVRESIEADLGDAERMVLHRKVAEALEGLPEGHPGDRRRAAELTWHFLEGDEPERALPYAVLAGDDAERVFAHAEAEMQYRRALSLARHHEDEEREAEALEKLGWVLTNMARYDEAIGVLEEAAQIHVRRGDLDAEGRAVAGIGLAYFNRGTHEEGMARVEPVLQRLEPPSDGASHLHSLAALSGAMARLSSMRRGADRLARFQRAADLARAAGDTELLVRIEPYRAYTLRNGGRLDEALRVFEEAVALAEVTGDLLSLVVALGGLGWCHADRGDNELALQASLRALQAIEPLGDPMELFTARLALGERHFVLGNWQEARVQFEQAWEIALGTGPSAFALAPAFALAKLCFRQGDLAAADWYDGWARERTVTGETYWADHWRRFTLAERHILGGDAEAALDELRHYTLALEVDRPHLMALEAWAYLEMGDPVRAQQILASAADLAHAQNNRNCLLQVLRVQAMLHAAGSRSEPAEATWHDVLSLARGMPYPYFEAEALLEGAPLRAGRGRYQEARGDLAQAQAIFQRLGAKADVARTQTALDALL